MTTVYLIRHAQAKGNLDRVFQGRYDGAVTELGYRQLENLAEKCREFQLDCIYSSPLSRAYETAQAVNRYYAHPILQEDGLLEIDGGDWEGKKWDSFPVDYPEINSHWEDCPWMFRAPNGESMAEVYQRMRETILKIVADNKDKTIGIVSHGCAIRNFLTFAKGLPVEQIIKTGWCDNTAISKIIFDDQFLPSVEWQNDSSHLEEEIKTFAAQLWWKKFEPKE